MKSLYERNKARIWVAAAIEIGMLARFTSAAFAFAFVMLSMVVAITVLADGDWD